MSSQTAMSLMNVTEFALWAVLGFLFWTKNLHRRFLRWGLFGVACGIGALPAFFFYGQSQHWFNDYCYPIYFYLYWTIYTASAVFLFFVCMEVFRSALSRSKG